MAFVRTRTMSNEVIDGMPDLPVPGDDGSEPTPPATGWQDPTFWSGLTTKVLGTLVALGVITSANGDSYKTAISGIVAGVFIIASHLLSAHYASLKHKAGKTTSLGL